MIHTEVATVERWSGGRDGVLRTCRIRRAALTSGSQAGQDEQANVWSAVD